MEEISLVVEKNIGATSMDNGSTLILDALPVQACSLYFPKLPDVMFFLQNVSLPEIRVNEVKQPTRYVDPNEIGEKVVFNPFSIMFLVDKSFRNWASIYNWMKRMTVSGSSVGEVDDPILIINGKPTIRFIGSWPMALGGIDFSSTVAEVEYVKTSLTINYDYIDYIGEYKSVDSKYS